MPGLDQGHTLLVAMQNAPGLKSLENAIEEVRVVADLCRTLQLIDDLLPRQRNDVLTYPQQFTISHLAGHGETDDRDPAQSRLLLGDWKKKALTVGDLCDMSIHERAPFLDSLSACSTSASKVAKLVDEGIHLASALQLAGFQHVVGTL